VIGLARTGRRLLHGEGGNTNRVRLDRVAVEIGHHHRERGAAAGEVLLENGPRGVVIRRAAVDRHRDSIGRGEYIAQRRILRELVGRDSPCERPFVAAPRAVRIIFQRRAEDGRRDRAGKSERAGDGIAERVEDRDREFVEALNLERAGVAHLRISAAGLMRAGHDEGAHELAVDLGPDVGGRTEGGVPTRAAGGVGCGLVINAGAAASAGRVAETADVENDGEA